MVPIYNSTGRTVGWIKDDNIIDRSNLCRAFIDGENVISYKGKYLGKMKNKYFWDKAGHAVAFLDKAMKGPKIPQTEISPLATLPPIPNKPQIPFIPLINPINVSKWSIISFDRFLSS